MTLAPTTAEHVRNRMEAAGLWVATDRDDLGVLRAYELPHMQYDEQSGRTIEIDPHTVVLVARAYNLTPQDLGLAGRLVGMVVIRNENVTYAEFAGQVFPMFPDGPNTATVERMWNLIEGKDG